MNFSTACNRLLTAFAKITNVLISTCYRNSEKENSYIVIGKWKTRQALERHFQRNEFELLLGAARVLGETFEMNIVEVLKTGGLEFAKEQIHCND